MATAHSLPRMASGPAGAAGEGAAAAVVPAVHKNESLVSSAGAVPKTEPLSLSAPLARLPVQLDVMIPIRSFRLRKLLALEPGQLVESQWSHGQDVPLLAGDVQLAWSEFEVVDSQLAVRLTRLA